MAICFAHLFIRLRCFAAIANSSAHIHSVCVCGARRSLTPLALARFNSMAKLARLTEKSFHPLGTFQDLRSLSLMVLKIIGALEKSKRARLATPPAFQNKKPSTANWSTIATAAFTPNFSWSSCRSFVRRASLFAKIRLVMRGGEFGAARQNGEREHLRDRRSTLFDSRGVSALSQRQANEFSRPGSLHFASARAYSRRIEFPLGDDEIRQPPSHMQHAQFAANEPTLTQIEK